MKVHISFEENVITATLELQSFINVDLYSLFIKTLRANIRNCIGSGENFL